MLPAVAFRAFRYFDKGLGCRVLVHGSAGRILGACGGFSAKSSESCTHLSPHSVPKCDQIHHCRKNGRRSLALLHRAVAPNPALNPMQETGCSVSVRGRTQWGSRGLTVCGPPSRLVAAKRMAEEAIAASKRPAAKAVGASSKGCPPLSKAAKGKGKGAAPVPKQAPFPVPPQVQNTARPKAAAALPLAAAALNPKP